MGVLLPKSVWITRVVSVLHGPCVYAIIRHMVKKGTSPSRKLVAVSTGRDVDELLRELYVVRRYNKSEIARSLSVSRETVRLWLLEAGIQRDEIPPLVAA